MAYVYIPSHFMLIMKVIVIIKTSRPKSKFCPFLFIKEPIHIAIKTPQLGLANTTLEEDPDIKARQIKRVYHQAGTSFIIRMKRLYIHIYIYVCIFLY